MEFMNLVEEMKATIQLYEDHKITYCELIDWFLEHCDNELETIAYLESKLEYLNKMGIGR